MARPSAGLSTKVSMPLTPELLAAIDDYRFEDRISNRSEALRNLLYLGLAALGRTVDDENFRKIVSAEANREASKVLAGEE